jgi:predicted DNA-binding transcriptional regulator AlpA
MKYQESTAAGPSGRPIPVEPDAMLDENEVAALIHQSTRTVQSYRLLGGGPPYAKLGRNVRYRRADVFDWIAQCTRRSTSDTGPERDSESR